jgi:transcriptional regulator with XRE-family HTH domain
MVARSAHAIDIEVGRRLRAARVARGQSQSKLASVLGTTFQQVQKYEAGANRISASKLYLAAACLDIPLSALFPPEGQAATKTAFLPPTPEMEQFRDTLLVEAKTVREQGTALSPQQAASILMRLTWAAITAGTVEAGCLQDAADAPQGGAMPRRRRAPRVAPSA